MSIVIEPGKIVLSDDHPQGLELLEAYLSDTPLEIRTAHHGEETLQLVNEWLPDIVLLDVMMPKISGFEVCRQLRQNSKTQSLGILMITALSGLNDVDRAVDVGADDFLTKPINKYELLIRIKSLQNCKTLPLGLPRAIRYIEGVQQNSR